MLASDRNPFADGWSPDGRFLLYEIDDPKTTWDLWVLPMSDGGKPRPFLQAEFRQEYARFSPDGRWVAYRSNESGRFEIYVAPFPGPGGKWQVSTDGGDFPLWRRDGREIFYLTPDSMIVAATVNGQGSSFEVGAVLPLFETRPPNRAFVVSGDGQRFLINTDVDQTSSEPLTVVLNWTAALKK